MAQLTIYLDEKTRTSIGMRAKMENVSVSQWVKEKIKTALNEDWPQSFVDQLGKLKAEDLERPKQPDLCDDATREEL
ncbi:MAG: hypothetical protein R3A13_02270 [Bdellovibrionota bacterium]